MARLGPGSERADPSALGCRTRVLAAASLRPDAAGSLARKCCVVDPSPRRTILRTSTARRRWRSDTTAGCRAGVATVGRKRCAAVRRRSNITVLRTHRCNGWACRRSPRNSSAQRKSRQSSKGRKELPGHGIAPRVSLRTLSVRRLPPEQTWRRSVSRRGLHFDAALKLGAN